MRKVIEYFAGKTYFTWNTESLVFEKISKFKVIFINFSMFMTGAFIVWCCLAFQYDKQQDVTVVNKIIEADVIVGVPIEKFTIERMADMVVAYNFIYPDIVMAQAVKESGPAKSPLFISNNNLFGMRESNNRCTTSSKSENGYAYYANWQLSVTDYAFYQSKYLSRLNREQYFAYLGRVYAEHPDYVKDLKEILKNNKIKSLLENARKRTNL